MSPSKKKIEYGDFQTPQQFAHNVCLRLAEKGISPDHIIEPTCGEGSFIIAASDIFLSAKTISGYDINASHIDKAREQLSLHNNFQRISLEVADFFKTNWQEKIDGMAGKILIVGNFPWVTNSVQSTLESTNIPKKSNIKGGKGYDAISGKANFDISEWMLLEVVQWLRKRGGTIAMLVKSSVARKVFSYASQHKIAIEHSFIVTFDAKKVFGVCVDACLMVMQIAEDSKKLQNDYIVYEGWDDVQGRIVGHRIGMPIKDLAVFDEYNFLVGSSPQKWRSGMKHDASSVMEFIVDGNNIRNGFGEVVDLEDRYLYPLIKGSEVGSGKTRSKKFVLVTQRVVGEATSSIEHFAPKTWAYLQRHASILDGRGSIIYRKNPRFSIFGVGDYAFLPWKIAICALYKTLDFRLFAPVDGKPVIFDDTVYYLSFETKEEAIDVLEKLQSSTAQSFLSSFVFWDEKRPVKTGILNVFDWSQLDRKGLKHQSPQMTQIELGL